jgi:hypothetical protein
VVVVCADVWVISLNCSWPQFVQRLLFTRLNFQNHPTVSAWVPTPEIPGCSTDIGWLLHSVVAHNFITNGLEPNQIILLLGLWKRQQYCSKFGRNLGERILKACENGVKVTYKRKVKLSLYLINQESRHRHVWGSGGIAPLFLNSELDGSEWSVSRPCRFTPGKRVPGTHWTGGWVAPEPVWTLCSRDKSVTTAGNRSPPSQPVVRPYTDWAVIRI